MSIAQIMIALFAVIAMVSSVAAETPETRVNQILDRLTNANANRDHVMIVAHRVGRTANGERIVAENSLSALERAIDLGG